MTDLAGQPDAAPMLDCESVESTVASLAAAAAVAADDLREAIAEFDEPDWREPLEQLWRGLLGDLGRTPEQLRFAGMYCFHGSRTTDPASFRREGILPLGQALDQVWEMLYALVADERPRAEWDALRDDVEHDGGGSAGEMYRKRTREAFHGGPYGHVVREGLFDVEVGWDGYLAEPEIVRDVTRFYAGRFGGDLGERFYAASKPVIVKYRQGGPKPVAVQSAFWYAYSKLRSGEMGHNAACGCKREGVPVPASDVVSVEIVNA